MHCFRLTVLISCVIAATPAFAQVDLTGTWARVGQNDNGAAREPVDLLGMPLSADGRAKALSYDIAALSATERQCQMYPPFYALVGPFPLQFVMVPEPEAVRMCRLLATRRGVLAGGSTGSVLAAVAARRHDIPRGASVVAISPDLGERYRDTIYDDAWVDERFGALDD